MPRNKQLTAGAVVFSLSFSSAGKGQFLTGIFLKQHIVLANLQEVAGRKNCCLRWQILPVIA